MSGWVNAGLVIAILALGLFVQYVMSRGFDRQAASLAKLMLEHDEQSVQIIDLVAEVRPELAERAEAHRAEIQRMQPNLLRVADGKSPSLRLMWKRGQDERRDRRAMRKLRRQVGSTS